MHTGQHTIRLWTKEQKRGAWLIALGDELGVLARCGSALKLEFSRKSPSNLGPPNTVDMRSSRGPMANSSAEAPRRAAPIKFS